MRTTVRLDDRLLAAAKAHAARSGRTLTALFDDAIRSFLTLESRPKRRARTRLPTFGAGGTRPGVDLDKTAGLLDAMEGTRATR